jgi:hypothetical protein
LFLLPLITLTISTGITPAAEGDLSLMFKATLRNAGTADVMVAPNHYAIRVHELVCNGKSVAPTRLKLTPKKPIELELRESLVLLRTHDDKEILFSALSDYLRGPIQRDYRPRAGRCAAIFIYEYWGLPAKGPIYRGVVQSNKVEFEVTPRRRSSPPGPSSGR